MTKATFDSLIDKYLKGECTSNEIQAIEDWIDLVGSDEDSIKSEENWENLRSEIWNTISSKTQKNSFRKGVRSKYLAFAASVILISGLSIWALNNKLFNKNEGQFSENLLNETNNSENFKKIRLVDGSVITLAPKSSISYPKKFLGNSREVFLNGKAFFEIEKNPKKPFLVHSEEIITKVIGTSFWIEPNKNKNSIEVKVVSGKVSVYEKIKLQKRLSQNSTNNGVIITPNQKVEFFESSKVFVAGIIDNPLFINSSEKKLANKPNYKFIDAPISEVIAMYEENYGINIEVETEHLNNCPITADLNGVPYYTALEIICKSINVKYETTGTNILISGKGCN